MPRDANGNYTLPAGNPVQSGTLITSTWANDTMPDLGAEVSDSLSRSGKGSMSSALKLADAGAVFDLEPTTGMRRAGTADVRLRALGTDVLGTLADGAFGIGKFHGVRVAKVAIDTDLATVISGIGSAETLLFLFPETWAVNANLTIPANVTLALPRGVDVSVASGIILTLVNNPVADRYKVFSGDGTVQGIRRHYPEWYGAVANDDSIDDAPAFNKMDFTGTSSGRQTVVDLRAACEYKLNSTWQINESIAIEGNEARFKTAAGITGVQFGTAGTRVNLPIVRNVGMLHVGATTETVGGVTYATNGVGIRFENVLRGIVEGGQIFNYESGIYFGDTFAVGCRAVGISVQGCENGVNATSGMNGGGLWGHGAEIQQCKNAIRMTAGTQITISGFIIESIVNRCLDLENVFNVAIRDIYTESVGDELASSQSRTANIRGCSPVSIQSTILAALKGAADANKHPLCCLNLEECEYVTLDECTFTWGQESHIIADAKCKEVIARNCKGSVDVDGDALRIRDNTPTKVVRVENKSYQYLNPIGVGPAPKTVNYVPDSIDLSTANWTATNATVAGSADVIAPDGTLSAHSVAYTSQAAACLVASTTPVVVGSQTKKLRIRFWAKLISRGTVSTRLPAIRAQASTITPGAVVERVEYAIGEEWEFFDMEVDQFTLNDGSTPNPVTSDTAITVSFNNRLLGDLITVAFWGIQLSRFDDPYYYAKADQSGAVDVDVTGGSSPIVRMTKGQT